MNSIKNFIIFLFGKDQKTRFRRLCLFIALVGLLIMLIQNLGYDKEHGWSWRPAAEININKDI